MKYKIRRAILMALANGDTIVDSNQLLNHPQLLALNVEAEAIRDSLKQELLNRETEELEVGQYMIRYQTIVTNHFNSSAFKKALPEVYNSFIRQGTSKRFTITA